MQEGLASKPFVLVLDGLEGKKPHAFNNKGFFYPKAEKGFCLLFVVFLDDCPLTFSLFFFNGSVLVEVLTMFSFVRVLVVKRGLFYCIPWVAFLVTLFILI